MMVVGEMDLASKVEHETVTGERCALVLRTAMSNNRFRVAHVSVQGWECLGKKNEPNSAHRMVHLCMYARWCVCVEVLVKTLFFSVALCSQQGALMLHEFGLL